MKKIFYLFVLSVSIMGCLNDELNTFEPQTEADIVSYLEANDINATKTNTGLYFLEEEEGTGENPTINSNVTVAYKGYLLNGTTFDQSSSTGISFNLNQVITGWAIGIPLFKEGGKGKLFIPPSLGYGNQSIGNIPPGSVLVFDIHLISIN